MSLRDTLIREEGWKRSVYNDHLGYQTIGVGHLVDERKGGGLPDEIISALLDHDIDVAKAGIATRLPWSAKAPGSVRDALVLMSFQLGLNGLLGFKKMLRALEIGDYAGAKREALDSEWAKQTPERAKRVTELFTDE